MEDQRDINAPPIPIAESLAQLPCALRCVLFESLWETKTVSSRSIFLNNRNIQLWSLAYNMDEAQNLPLTHAELSESEHKNWGLL